MPDVTVVGVDDSDCARRAALFAAAQAKSGGTGGVTLVYVVEWSPYSIYTHEELAERHKERDAEIARANSRVLEPLAAELRTLGVTAQTIVRHGHPSRALIDVARELGAKQLVLGRRGRSRLAEIVFGSTASNLVQASPVPVTVVP